MKILLNDIITPLPSEIMTIAEFAKWQNINTCSVIVVNDILIDRKDWDLTPLKDLDRLTVI